MISHKLAKKHLLYYKKKKKSFDKESLRLFAYLIFLFGIYIEEKLIKIIYY